MEGLKKFIPMMEEKPAGEEEKVPLNFMGQRKESNHNEGENQGMGNIMNFLGLNKQQNSPKEVEMVQNNQGTEGREGNISFYSDNEREDVKVFQSKQNFLHPEK